MVMGCQTFFSDYKIKAKDGHKNGKESTRVLKIEKTWNNHLGESRRIKVLGKNGTTANSTKGPPVIRDQECKLNTDSKAVHMFLQQLRDASTSRQKVKRTDDLWKSRKLYSIRDCSPEHSPIRNKVLDLIVVTKHTHTHKKQIIIQTHLKQTNKNLYLNIDNFIR